LPVRIKGECNSGFYNPAITEFCLRNSWLLDFGTTLHISHELHRFTDFRNSAHKKYVLTGGGKVVILGWGNVPITMTYGNTTRKGILKDVAYCHGFTANLVSWDLLKLKVWKWDTDKDVLWRVKAVSPKARNRGKKGSLENSTRDNFCKLLVTAGQRVIEYRDQEEFPTHKGFNTAYPVQRARPQRRSLRKPRVDPIATGTL
jgi:hypothetical protein